MTLKNTVILAAMVLWIFGPVDRVSGDTVELSDIDSGLTSPTGEYRWRDAADQLYSADYRDTYNYTQASVQVVFDAMGSPLHGTLTAVNLKPNFVYQVKLVGTPGSTANESIGLAGRWWQEMWDGTDWTGGQNLNNKGDGSFPNPNDQVYFQRRDLTDPTSPTGHHYRYTGYLAFAFFMTDDEGDAVLEFETGSSFHVFWKTSQREPAADDGPVTSTTFDADESPAYNDTGGDDYPLQSVGIFGEWERLPMGGVNLQPGAYQVQIILTEESFHASSSSYGGNWAGAMSADFHFCITHPSDRDKDGDLDGSDLSAYIFDARGVELEEFCADYGKNECPNNLFQRSQKP